MNNSKKLLTMVFNKKADVFKMYVGRLRKTASKEIKDGVSLRFDKKTNKVICTTIFNFIKRAAHGLDVPIKGGFSLPR